MDANGTRYVNVPQARCSNQKPSIKPLFPWQNLDISPVLAAVLLLKLLDAMLQEPIAKVLTSQVGVSCRGLHLKDSVLDFQQGDIEGAATHVINQDLDASDS